MLHILFQRNSFLTMMEDCKQLCCNNVVELFPKGLPNAMQVIHVHERRHWAVISTIGCDNSTVKYYDSFYRDISVQTVQTIVSFLNPCKSINAQIMDVQAQKVAAYCGLYCLSYCVSLACCVCVQTKSNVIPLVSCLENGILTEFPIVR